jgi:2-isopropylmalate synthase
MNNDERIVIYDTTLRDGNQAIGVGLSLTDKLLIAERLAAQGIPYIEGGWPNPKNTVDAEFYRRIGAKGLSARVAAFGSTRRKGVDCATDPFVQALVASGAPVATIFGKSWDLHVKKVIRTTLAENLDMIAETVACLKREMDEVFFDAEHFFDGYLRNPSYALKTVRVAFEAGADCVVLCDTNGGMLPMGVQRIVRAVRERFEGALGIHVHNDAGCAEANSFVAVEEGCRHVQGTINGIGERCGNANLCTLIPGLQLKMGYRVMGEERLRELTATSVYISELANMPHNIRLPYVGESAFSHKAGAHVDGVLKTRESFEHIAPEVVGNRRRFVVSDQAGTGTILEKLGKIKPGVDKQDPLVRTVLAKITDMEAAGYRFEAAEGTFELIVREMLGLFESPFTVKGFRVIEEKRPGEVRSEATIKVEEDERFEHTAADGDGPVNALDNALRKALMKFFPGIADVKLEDFKVRVLDGSEGTEAKVRVLIESSDGTERWGTIGVSTNIIEASWLALIDSLKYKLMREGLSRGGSRGTTGRRNTKKGRSHGTAR